MVAPLINISAAILETFKLTKEQRDNITSHHNGIVGHMGVQSTIQRLLNSGFDWLHMRQRVNVSMMVSIYPPSGKGPMKSMFRHVGQSSESVELALASGRLQN